MKRFLLCLALAVYGLSTSAQVEKPETYLKYRWKNVPASAYLQFAKTGDAEVFKGLTENIKALKVLIEAESAEKRGRYIPQIINGVYYFSNMSAWINPVVDVECACVIPDPSDPPKTKTSAEIADMLALALELFGDKLNEADPMIAQTALWAIKTKADPAEANQPIKH